MEGLTDKLTNYQQVNLGVPKQDIVLGFHPPFMREMTDYAVG